MTNRCQIIRLGRFRPSPVPAVKISKLTSLYKPRFVCERQRGEEITTSSREKAASESRGSTRVAVHSSSGGRETSLSRDCDGRDCVQRALRVDTCDDPVEDSNVRDLLVEAVGAAYQGSTTLKEQQWERRQQREGLASL